MNEGRLLAFEALFECRDVESPFYGRKCLGSFNPARVLQNYEWLPLLMFDLQRASEERSTSKLELPSRVLDVYLTPEQICEKLYNWKPGHIGAIDIEGGVNKSGKPKTSKFITCMSIAESPEYAFVIDWRNLAPSKAPMMYDAVKWWLENPDIPKVAQQFLYETFCIAWQHKIAIANLHGDTMLSGWEIYPELPKGLGTQTSIWTREPYYKDERTVLNNDVHLTYCCKDTTVTYELHNAHMEYLSTRPAAKAHYEFNMELIPQLSYMQLRGFNYDKERADSMLGEIEVEMEERLSQIEVLNGAPLNCNSPKQLCDTLYKVHGFPKQFKKEKGRLTKKLTADTPALLKLQKLHNSSLIYAILKWKHDEGIRRQLAANCDHDGRIRAGYNPVGTETGRFTCYTCDSGMGYNLQTTTKRVRVCFIADPGMTMFQLDLSGADGWTVAAHAQKLGDGNMMDDYRHGVKPAKVICVMHLHKDQSIANLPSSQLAEIIANTAIPVWLYNAAKAVQHGSSYGMKGPTMSANILRRSWKDSGTPVHVAPKDCIALQDLFFKRYPGVCKWQSWLKLELQAHGELSCASGHVRRFFGRRTDNSHIAVRILSRTTS